MNFLKTLLMLIIAVSISGFSLMATAETHHSNPPDIASVDTLLFEDFNGAVGPFATNPLPGWTVIDNGVPEWDETSWSRYVNTPYPEYWNGDLARVMFDGTDAISDWLISPSMNCSGETTISFSFKHRHSNSSSNPDTAFVLGSTDGGLTWPHVMATYDSSLGALNHPDTVVFDISSWAAGQSDVKVAFRLYGSYVLTWYIDEPCVEGDVTDTLLYEDFNGGWGPFGNKPPDNWTIINETQPDPPNGNDWSRWYYSSWLDTVALAYDNVNSQTADEWLITPVISFSDDAVCSLTFYNSYWDDSADDTDSAVVYGSTDGGTTWPHQVVVYSGADDRSTIKAESWRGFDISTWAQGEDNVKFAFHYVKDDPSYIGWWFFDDLNIYEKPLSDDNVAALSIDYPFDFIVVDEGYFPKGTIQNFSTTQQTVSINMVVTDPYLVEVYNRTEIGVPLEPIEILQGTFQTEFIPTVPGFHRFTMTVINPDDTDPSDDTIQTWIYCHEHNGTGGPDDGGYSYIDNTDDNGPIFNWVDISATGTQVEPTSHYFMSDAIAIGFNFDFYGSTYSSVFINSHGELHLGSRDTWTSTNDCPLPDASTPHAPLLAVFWDVLYIHYEEGQGVYYQYFDQPVYDYFIVQWNAKISDQLSDSISFQCVMVENGDIFYQYNHLNDLPGGRGQEATVGMEYDVIPSGITYYCNDDNPANRLEEELVIRWTQEYLGPDVSIEMIPDNPPVTVNPGGSFTFTGIITNNTDQIQIITVATFLRVPTIGWYGPIGYYPNIPLAPNDVYTAPGAIQYIPSNAILGDYLYMAYCGIFPSTPYDMASFPFTVVGAVADYGVDDWNLKWFDETPDVLPSLTELHGNYPNPFNASTNISFDIAQSGKVNLSVFNLLGQKVDELMNGYIEAGKHNITWDASTYSSGVYFYKLTAGDKVFTKRMTLLK